MLLRSLQTATTWVVALCATGCATTGLAWVHERESGVDLTPPQAPSESVHRIPEPLPSEALGQPAERPRPRLDRTITLGGTTEWSTRRYDSPAPAADPRATTIVNVYVTQPPPSMVYGPAYGYSYGYSAPAFIAPRIAPASAQAPAALRPGLDWPAVPNHGPAFPYRTGPASPWDGAGTRRR